MGVLEEKNRRLLEEGIFSNVTLVVGMDGQHVRIKAHKGILSVSSPVFHSLLLESKEQNEFRILNINPTVFEAFLKYIYVNEDPELKEDNWAEYLYASEKYQIIDLKEKCIEFVRKNFTHFNACGFFNQAIKNHVDNLVPFIKDAIACNAEESLTSNSFLEIENNYFLNEILSLDLRCKEILIFKSALKWASSKIKDGEEQNGANIRQILGPAFYSIRFPRLSPNEFNRKVIPKNILTDQEILSILKKKDYCPFLCGPRKESLFRFDELVRGVINTKCHSLKFQVDDQVKIYIMEINVPCNEGNIIEGRVFIRDEQNTVLSEESFTIHYHKMLKTHSVFFDDPIFINPKTWYIASLEFDSIPVETWMGINGHSEIKYDGVKLTFEDDSSSEETNVFEGQIAAILFRK